MKTRHHTFRLISFLSLFTLMAMTMLTGCNPARSTAKKRAKTFVKAYLADSELREQHFGKLDSTFQVGDSLLALFRQKARENELFKSDVSFDDAEATVPVYFLGLTYKDSQNEEHHLTFYYDKTLDNLLAVKGY